jgi:hypothetical protein
MKHSTHADVAPFTRAFVARLKAQQHIKEAIKITAEFALLALALYAVWQFYPQIDALIKIIF